MTAPAGHGGLNAEALRERRADLTRLMAVGTATLIIVTAAQRGLMSWPLVFLRPAGAGTSATELTPVSDAIVLFWGALNSAILVLALAPALFSYVRDVNDAAKQAVAETSFEKRIEWQKGAGVYLAPLDLITQFAGTLGPLLVIPALDTLGKVGGTS